MLRLDLLPDHFAKARAAKACLVLVVVVLIVSGGRFGLIHAKQVGQVSGKTLKVGPFAATAALPAFNELINVYAQISVPFGFWVSTLKKVGCCAGFALWWNYSPSP